MFTLLRLLCSDYLVPEYVHGQMIKSILEAELHKEIAVVFESQPPGHEEYIQAGSDKDISPKVGRIVCSGLSRENLEVILLGEDTNDS